MGADDIESGADTKSGSCIQETGESQRWEMTRRSLLMRSAAAGVVLGVSPMTLAMSSPRPPVSAGSGADPLREHFGNPPDSSKVWTYWWWLDGAASREGITADLDMMRKQGIGGVLLVNAGEGGPNAPAGPRFMSEAWRENFRFAVQEAARLGIEMGAGICSGWDCGGPWVTKEDAIKDLVWDETVIEGPGDIDQILRRPSGLPPPGPPIIVGPPEPPEVIDLYRDIAVLTCREAEDGVWRRDDIQDLTPAMSDGRLRWQAPPGRWTVLRLGYMVRKQANPGEPVASQQVKLSGEPEPAWEIDPMSADAMDRHFAQTGAKLIADAGALAGKTLKYLYIDSWELGVPTWTEKMLEEFRARRGYDPTRYLPGLAGKKLDTSEETARFTWDYRRTVADLTAQNYYGRLSELCHEHGLGTHSEAAGPFFMHFIDGLECEGTQDVPMAEFWSSRESLPLPVEQGVSAPFFRSAEREFPAMNFGCVRQAATAAHVYGKALCQAESYTSFNADWSEDPYFLKGLGDRAFCQGLTRQVLQSFVLQSTLTDKPGYEWEHVGTHFDRNVTWMPLSHGWLTYLARCQHLLRQGRFSADILYFAGETIPNFVMLDRKPIAGYDCDVINTQALLARASACNGRVVLPDGLSYRYLVLPAGAADDITPAALQKMRELVEGGVTLVGSPPKHALGLMSYPQSEQQVKRQSQELWGQEGTPSGIRRVGAGRVIWGHRLEEVIRADGLPPDVELRGATSGADLDWLHRHDAQHDIYFLANLTERAVQVEAVFRVSGQLPELWDPVTGEIRDLENARAIGARTAVALQFAPKQSWFVVFRRAMGRRSPSGAKDFPALIELGALSGPWEVGLDEAWGGPRKVVFQELEDWSQRPEEGIRYYSGIATYRKAFDLPAGQHRRVYLDLGEVKNVARVRLNGRDLGVVWTAPWRVVISEAVRPKDNRLEIEVVNLWPNRLIGDGQLPKEKRLTKTNVRTYDTPVPPNFPFCAMDPECRERTKTGAPPKLLRSGLLGPVTLVAEV